MPLFYKVLETIKCLN